VGQHAKDFPAHLRALIKRSVHSDRALHNLEAELIKDNKYKSLIGTTQAIDLIQGGVKTNALPEEAWAVVNHRIATQRFDPKKSPWKHVIHVEFAAPFPQSNSAIYTS
jgi:Gly-Xaa carboxypeptidase